MRKAYDSTIAGRDATPEDPSFEDVVVALLQVAPTGITGQRAKRKDDDAPDDEKSPPPE